MPRRRKHASRAPAQDLWRQKKTMINPAITEKLMEKFISGETIPIIDRETYLQYKTAGKAPVTPKPPKDPATPKTPKEPATPKGTLEVKPLPEPIFSVNESYDIPDMPYKPLHYIRYIEPSKEDIDSRVDYDMDEEDVAWLDIENKKRAGNGAPAVSMDDFEILMDRFEKESHFEIYPNEMDTLDMVQDDEAICCICMDGESQPYNEILFCEMCNLAVHQECYGIPYIPEGQWLCRRCIHSPSAAVDCILCPSNTGALKMAEGGLWSHILCAIMVPEVQFANPVFLEPVECVAKIPSSRWKLTCQLCKLKGVGACIQCTQKKCNFAFHATCAQQAGFYMKFLGRPGDPKTKLNKMVYCTMHRPKREGSEIDKFEHFRQKMLKNTNKPITFLPVLPADNVQGIGDRVSFQNKNNFVTKMISYWSLKRKIRLGVPLLRTHMYELNKNKLICAPQNDDDMPEKDFKICLRFRHEMEKVRLLLELVRKREKLKNEFIKIQEKFTELKLMPMVSNMKKLIQIFNSYDEDEIFQKPVDVKEVPSYTDIIKYPMDLSTMSTKIDNYEYNSLEDFEKDFNLMINNCLHFNKKNSFYYQAAINLRNRSRNLFKKAKEDLKALQNSDNLICCPTIKLETKENHETSSENNDEIITTPKHKPKTTNKKSNSSKLKKIETPSKNTCKKNKSITPKWFNENTDVSIKEEAAADDMSETDEEDVPPTKVWRPSEKGVRRDSRL